ncbi:CHASE3 domain-containing protein [Denitromonas halophila]|uniref:Histidine kinase n=1 Tax=Denitromonas halophila TaxID=1629404 RepID=A0A557R0S6_9RHOO|nr:CHASE3 domain-containing protein [Denitromonas halophila]TVO58768.1 histidine kinase [Denitromonas halophila]
MPEHPPTTEPRRSLGRHWRGLLLGLGAALVTALLVSSHWQATASLGALRQLQLQAERTGRLDSLLIQLVDAESGVRGYLLSGERAYLEPYLNSLATLDYTLEDIRQDLAPTPEDQNALAQIRGLVVLKKRLLADAVSRGRPGPEGSAEGRRYMNDLRKAVTEHKGRILARGQRSLDASIAHVDATRWVVLILAGGALLLLVLLFVMGQRQLRLRERIADLLRRENRWLDELVQERTAELSELASYLTRTRETEQARLARELHDELGALLTAARMDTAWLVRKLDPDALAPHRERFDRLLETLDQGISLKRRIIDDLQPPLLRELGLVVALRSLAEDFAERSGAELHLDLPKGDLPLSAEAALALYRIAQEALTNIRRHAGARTVTVALSCKDEAVQLRIEDDGTGFVPARVGRRHYGLAGMRHRMQMFSGVCEIDSRPGAGTRIRARLPLVVESASVS